MRQAQTNQLQDRGFIIRASDGAPDRHGVPAVSLTPDARETRCAYTPAGGNTARFSQQVPVKSASLRLPWGTDINTADKFQVTHRRGQVLAEPITLEITNVPTDGTTAVVCAVRAIGDASQS